MIGWGILGWIVFGGLAGWIASKIMKVDGSMGFVANIACGIAGALLGGWLLAFFVDTQLGTIMSLLTAIVGACLVIWIVNFIRSKVGK